jgi:hypothetical protein
MRERRLIAVMMVCAGGAATLLISTRFTSAQKEEPDKTPPIYNPHPPGILPADLNSEIARVLREVDFIEGEALAQLRALTPPTLTGQIFQLFNYTRIRKYVTLSNLVCAQQTAFLIPQSTSKPFRKRS